MTTKEPLNIKYFLKEAIQVFKENNVSEPESSAEVLLFNVLDKNRAYLYAHGEGELTEQQEKLFLEFVERRKGHEPVWYILGEVEFYGRKFKINNNVLTPRPETELLVKEVLETLNPKSEILNKFKIQNSNELNIIELGTGAGGIIISLFKEIERIKNKELSIKYIATDISAEALEVAKENAKRLNVETEIEFLKGDLLSPILNTQYLLHDTTLVANLPYIPEEDMISLQFDVLHHEPRVALSGGAKGIEVYERLMHQLKEIDFQGLAFFEIGIEQGDLLKPIVKKIFPEAEVEVMGDLARIDRVVKINF